MLQCAQALTQLGLAVDVVTYPLGADPDVEGLRCIRCANPFAFRHVPIGFSWRKLVLDLPLAWTARRALRHDSYAFIHAVEEAVFPAILLGRRFGVPVVYDMQSSLPQHFRRGPLQTTLEWCERWALRRVSAVACSAGLAERVRSSAPATDVIEWRFPSPVDAPAAADVAGLRARLEIPAEAAVIVYAGSFEPYQGLPLLIDAMARVRREEPHAVLVLVGATPDRMPDLVGNGAADAGVRIVSRQPRERIGVFLALADVLVSARLYGDNLPLKIFDYLAAGRPIVATDIPAHRSVLRDETSTLVRPEAGALAAGILEIVRSRGPRPDLDGAPGSPRSHAAWMSFVDTVDRLRRHAVTNE